MVTNPVGPAVQGPQPVAPKAAPTPPSRRWLWAIGLVMIVVGVGAAVLMRNSATEPNQRPTVAAEVRTAKVTVGPIKRMVRVAGQTAARDFASITAPIQRGSEGGRPLSILMLATGGALVKKGDLIVELDPEYLKEHVDGIQDTVSMALSDVKKRRAEQMIDWENLQQSVRIAKAEWDKARLEASASEVRTEIERMLLKLVEEEAEARYKQVQSDLVHKQVVHKAEIRILEMTMERHQRHHGRHSLDLEKYSIKAPMDGLIVIQQIYRGGGESQQVSQGDAVYPGQMLLKIVNPSSMQVEGTINQSDSSEFRVGQKAVIALDAFPGVRLDGSIYSIGALAVGGFRQNYYIRSVPIKVSVRGTDSRLIPDLSASMDIAVEEAEHATLLPVEAIREQDGKQLVHVKQAAGFERREIKVGVRSHTHVAVLEGVQPGEEVRLD